ncbi:type IV pilus modification PilV family protein [Arhodomonas sp. AD133]|uniref:type IV pilus modification PilV family protein n=1 Tax=Arhodomonas sp. AD133 TaxID=3415009 RepID=UPI003EBF7E7F
MIARQKGFSLLELLVAFTVMAIGLTVVLQAISGGLRNTAIASDYTQALQIAERRLTLAEAEQPVPEGERSGRAGERFRWTERVTPVDWNGDYSDEQAQFRLWRIDVRVSWGDGSERDVRLTSLRVERNT